MQRRAAVLADLQEALQGDGLVTTVAARVLDQFLDMKFNTSLASLMERAQVGCMMSSSTIDRICLTLVYPLLFFFVAPFFVCMRVSFVTF